MTEKKAKAKTNLLAGLRAVPMRPVGSRAVPMRDRGMLWLPGNPEAVRPLQRGEGMPILVASVFLALIALGVCYRHGYTLLYGDAVAHLGNARRILDSRYPGLNQLGGAWLPLPHLLMLPFIGNMRMWQTGLAAAPSSMVCFAASVVAIWRLSRRLMRLRWALVATLFYALNPNLLYLATTAMTETVFLALFCWSVVATVEAVAAIRAAAGSGNAFVARRQMLFAGLLVLLMVFTRYDGWVMGAAVWCSLAWAVWRSEATLRRQLLPTFAVFTAICLAGPLLWFGYNAHFDGDWLDFLRGPYSAAAIERKTSHPGLHYPGWHNPWLAGVYFLRTAQIDAAVWELGWALLAAAVYGSWVSWRAAHLSDGKAVAKVGYPAGSLGVSGRSGPNTKVLHLHPRAQSARAGDPASAQDDSVRQVGQAERLALLLWVPLPFYAYSVAFGSVPLFIPQLPPHAFYNARYGMELLPALCVYPAMAAERLDVWLRGGRRGTHLSDDGAVAKVGHPAAARVGRPGEVGWRRLGARFWPSVAGMLCVLNALLMMYGLGSAGFLRAGAAHARQLREAYAAGYLPAARRYALPLVLQEGLVNAETRVPFEQSLANVLDTMAVNAPVLMSVTAHVGAVQDAGRDLRSVISEDDEQTWRAALADPAHKAAYVIAIEGDAVAKAVAEHPAGLGEIEVVRTVGQPTARVYQSTVYKP